MKKPVGTKLIFPFFLGCVSMMPIAAIAVTADDVVCDGCVDSADIAGGAVRTADINNGAVTGPKLRNGAVATYKLADNAVTTAKLSDGAVGTAKLANAAVGTAKIKNGAITYAKLSPDLKALVDDAMTFDYRDFEKADNVTEKVFALEGDFGNCGGAGAPDTEVRTSVTDDLGGGVSRITETRWRYTGGSGGTPCLKDIVVFIADSEAVKLIRNRRFEADGVTKIYNYWTGYNKNTDPDLGLVLFTSAMREGASFGSAGRLTEIVNGGTNVFMSTIALVATDSTETIDEGGPNQETFNNCITTHEDRKGALGIRSTVRTRCPGIGGVSFGNANVDGTYQIWSLISYTTSS